MKRLLFASLLIFTPFILFAQTVIPEDSIRGIKKDSLKVNFIQPEQKQLTKAFLPKSIKELYKINTSKFDQPTTPTLNLPKLNFYIGPPLIASYSRNPYANDYDFSGRISLDKNSWITGGASRHMYPNGINQSATAIYNRRVTDKLIIGAGETINKYSLGGKVITYGQAHILMGYQFNNRMRLTLTGDYMISQTEGSAGPGSLVGNFFPEMPGDLSYGFTPTFSTNLNFDYQINNWLQFSPGLYSNHYRFYSNKFNDYGINGKLSIRAHEYIKLNLYGQKSFRGADHSLENRTLYPQDMYGGGLEVKMTETLRVETGVIREINPWTGKWQTKPYIKPVIQIK